MANYNQGFPGPIITDQTGKVKPDWYTFFLNMYQRLGGATGNASIILDGITSIIGSMLVRTSSAWTGLEPGTANKVLKMGAQLPAWQLLDGNSFAGQSPNSFFAGPTGSSPGTAVFRQLVTSDLDDTRGQYPGSNTDDLAAAGNIGEYISDSATNVPMSSGSAKDIISISLTPGDWDVWGNITTAPGGSTTTSDIKAWVNTVSATDPSAPNGGAYYELGQGLAAGNFVTAPVGTMRLSLSNEATVYLSANVTFAVSNLDASGFIAARRAR